MNVQYIVGGILLVLSFAYPLEEQKDVFARAVFFLVGGLMIAGIV